MFIRDCGEPEQHEAHEYTQQWRKEDLEFLLHPEEYPDQWKATYKCNGRYVEAWKVAYLHTACPECEDCAERALLTAQRDGSPGATWKMMIPVEYPAGTFAEVGHMASVERI